MSTNRVPNRSLPKVGSSLAERLWARFERDPATGCWEWQGCMSPAGYGLMRFSYQQFQAHRLVYELVVEPIPSGLTIDHLCRNRACVNPSHLEPVTNAENIRRGLAGIKNSSKTHCDHGHEFTPTNIYWRNNGRWRQCRTCAIAAATAHTRRRRAVSPIPS